MKTTKNINDLSIGIFDSGLGGLSICNEITQLLPNESIIYLADSLNAPYGEKNKDEIINLCIKNTELLLELGCKIIVVACNTATTNAIKYLRKNYSIPFIGIEPAIKPAALHSKTNIIGVLATKGTLSSELFASTSKQYRAEVDFIEVEGKGLVTLIESGEIEKTEPLLKEYVGEMVKKGADKIVLGCTHYPFLIPIIQKIVPNNVSIIDSGKAVANRTKQILDSEKLQCSTTSSLKLFYTNNDVEIMKGFIERIGLKTTKIAFRNF